MPAKLKDSTKPPTHKNRLGASSKEQGWKNTHSLSFHPPAIKNTTNLHGTWATPYISALVQISTFIWNARNISNTLRRHSQSQMRLQMRRLMPEGGRGSLSYPRQRPSCRSHDSGSHGAEISRDGSARHEAQFAETTTQKPLGIFPLNYSLAPSPLVSSSITPSHFALHRPSSFPAAKEPIRRVMTSSLTSQWALRFEDASRISMRLVLSGAQAKLISIMVLQDHLSLNAHSWSNTHTHRGTVDE